MTTQQSEALRLANILRGIDARSLFANEKLSAASAALENQHARITELEAQLAQRFDAADMATAAAQGFRDGVAPVSAGSEPVATVFTMEALTPGGGVKYQVTIHKAVPAGTKLYTHPSPPEGMAGWISVDERLPEVGVTVLVYEPFRHGEDWPGTVRILFDYICPDYEDWHDHCASHEHFMAVGGANACGPDVTCIGPSEKAPYTHWMPLPPAPGPADGESK